MEQNIEGLHLLSYTRAKNSWPFPAPALSPLPLPCHLVLGERERQRQRHRDREFHTYVYTHAHVHMHTNMQPPVSHINECVNWLSIRASVWITSIKLLLSSLTFFLCINCDGQPIHCTYVRLIPSVPCHLRLCVFSRYMYCLAQHLGDGRTLRGG